MLVAEDDENEQILLKRAFSTVEVHAALSFVKDGDEAVNYLGGTGQFADRGRFPFRT